MTKSIILKVTIASLLFVIIGCKKQTGQATKAVSETKSLEQTPTSLKIEKSIYDFKMNDIDGKPVSLAKYKGKVLMIVNVASKCGATPQYTQLQQIYEKYKDKDFYILGFPANNFGSQEPGTNEQIKTFCTTNYNVTFPMFAKISVKGDDKHPLYKYLTEEQANPDFNGEITWNFNKFLIGKDGQTADRFLTKIKPDAPEVIKAIETALEL